MAYSLRARVVFPGDRPPIEGGVVTIEGERIVAVGAGAAENDAVDLEQAVLLPGFVNAHTHLEFSHLRQPLGEPGMALVDWIRLVLRERSRGEVRAGESTSAGIRESVAAGVTAVGDIATAQTGRTVEQGVDAKTVPAAETPHLTLFQEAIGFSRARADSAFAAVLERLAVLRPAPGVSIGLSPHAPYTVSPDLLRRLVQTAQERNLPVAMHVAESLEELELLAQGSGPFARLLEERGMWDAAAIPRARRPLDYLRVLSQAPRALVIHGNYLDDRERAFLAAHAERMSLVYCPRTQAYFQHQPYPLSELLASGVRVALGTDSRASNPDLDLLGEMRFVAAAYPAIDPDKVLRMGTLSGAEALGLASDLGSITPGKLANLVAIPLPNGLERATTDALVAVLSGRDSPCAVWIRGARVEPRSQRD